MLQKCEWNDILALQLPFSASRAFISLESVGLRIVKTIDITFPLVGNQWLKLWDLRRNPRMFWCSADYGMPPVEIYLACLEMMVRSSRSLYPLVLGPSISEYCKFGHFIKK